MPPISKIKNKSTCGSMSVIQLKDVKKHDVLLGRGKSRFKHPGNIAYRALIDSRLDFYFKGNRTEKGGVVLDIIKEIKGNGGRFLKTKETGWQEVDLRVAREKVGHSIRDTSKSTASFEFQDDVKDIFDENSKFEEIFAYVLDNYTVIVAQISKGESTKKPSSKKTQKEIADNSDEEDTDDVTVSMDDEISSISSAGSDVEEDNEMEAEDVPQIPNQIESAFDKCSSRRRSSARASFVRDFISKLNEESSRLAYLDTLECQRNNADQFRLITIASIDDWIDLEASSEQSGDEWSVHLESLASLQNKMEHLP
jgi:hypothetical protein